MQLLEIIVSGVRDFHFVINLHIKVYSQRLKDQFLRVINLYIFSEADARKAMSKNRQNMQHRYVELFYEGPSGGAPPMRGYGRPAQGSGYGNYY